MRQRLTERRVDFVVRQVAAESDDRAEMRAETGEDSIPTLQLEDGTAIQGMDEIVEYLERTYPEAPDAEQHRQKAVADLPNFTPR